MIIHQAILTPQIPPNKNIWAQLAPFSVVQVLQQYRDNPAAGWVAEMCITHRRNTLCLRETNKYY